MTEFGNVDTFAISLAFLTGVILGGLYFGALWFTVQRLTRVRRPALLVVSSLVVRLAILLLGFYLIVLGGHWNRLLVALIGFVAARTLLMKRLKPAKSPEADTRHREASS